MKKYELTSETINGDAKVSGRINAPNKGSISDNTGSPKFPLLEDILDEIFGNREACGQGAEYVKQTFCIIERQLRAGA